MADTAHAQVGDDYTVVACFAQSAAAEPAFGRLSGAGQYYWFGFASFLERKMGVRQVLW